MNRRNFLKATAITTLYSLAGCNALAQNQVKAKPNFLFILVDDLGWTDLGCFGSTFYETPNIDKLCASGMKFTNAYAACPVCSPTRASIMAGKYPSRMDTTDYFGAPQPNPNSKSRRPLQPARYLPHLPLEEVTIAEALKEAGYGTFFAGKWHLGESAEYWPKAQGFDVNKGGWSRGGPYGPGKYFVPYGVPTLEDGPKGEHLPDRLATETVKFIDHQKGKPFLTYLAFYSVHTPLVAREDLKQKYIEKKKKMNLEEKWGQEGERKVREIQEHAVYAGMIEAMDLAVGKVLDHIKAKGLDENTIVIFMSDNGGLSTSEGHPTCNYPLRAGKGWMYEGGIREPMIVRWPGVTQKGSVCDSPVISTDFYPTMLEMADLSAKPKQHLDGQSFAPLLKGKEMNREPLFWHYPHYGNQGGAPTSAVRMGDWKLIKWYEDDKLELFNLKDDISEKNNLAKTNPAMVKKLKAHMDKMLKETNAKLPTRNPNAK
ncbi:MAG: sulfatase [Phycisphaerae bacterium]|nr:sulfatase [Phycisphaerae bacterium]